MMKEISIRSIVGVAVSAATLLALAPFGAANADPSSPAQPQQINISKSTGESITIKAPSAAAIKGHQFSAVQIGTYGNAETVDGTTLSSVSVATVSGIESAAETALVAAKKKANITPTDPDSRYTNNPVGEIAEQWLGYSASSNTANKDTTSNTEKSSQKYGWDGGLRSFVTSMVKSAGFAGKFTAAGNNEKSTVTAAGADSANISVQTPGIYLVEDITDVSSATGPKDSIPMLVSTGITAPIMGASTPVAFKTLNGNTLGQVAMKADGPTVEKKIDTSASNDSSLGGKLHYIMTSKVPLTTGFDHYLFTMIDNPAQKGLTYNNDAVVTIGNETLAKGTAFTDASFKFAGSSSTNRIVFDLSPSIMSKEYQATITVKYSMSINDEAEGGALKNGVTLVYSNDFNKPALSDKIDVDSTGEPTACTPENCPNGTVNSDKVDGNNNAASAFYFRHFTLINEAKSDSSKKLDGAVFQVFEKGSSTPIKFYPVAGVQGAYKKAANQSDSAAKAATAVTDLEVRHADAPANPTGSATDAPVSVGELRVDGLKDNGTYTVKEIHDATGYSQTFMPSTDVTLSGATTSAAKSAFTDTGDAMFGLISAKTTTTPVSMDDNGAVVVKSVTSLSQLPLTGGAGMLMALVVIAALAAGTGISIAVRRRMHA